MPIVVTEKDTRSWVTWIATRIFSFLSPQTIIDLPKIGTGWKDVQGSPELPPAPFGMKDCSVVHRVVDGFHVYDILPGPSAKKDSSAPKRKIYYLAGGAFLAPAGFLQWSGCAELVKDIPNTTASLVSYPLLPLNTAPTAYASIQKVMQTLLAESRANKEEVTYIGDSAGSQLVLTLPLASLKEDSKALLPSAIVAIAPVVDGNMSNPDSVAIQPKDVILNVDFCKKATSAWSGGWSLDDPRISAIKADLSQFAKHGIKVHGIVGTYDVLAPDACLYMEKLRSIGVDGRWLIWDKQGHDFVLSSVLNIPEAVIGMNWLKRVITGEQ